MQDTKTMIFQLREQAVHEPPGVRALLENAARALEELTGEKWIRVKDRLPEEEQDVLLFTRAIETYGRNGERKKTYRNTYYGYCDEGQWLTSYCHGCEYIYKVNEKNPTEVIEVTHWMPLPEPPKEE